VWRERLQVSSVRDHLLAVALAVGLFLLVALAFGRFAEWAFGAVVAPLSG
jgi:hypothetical protein